MISNKVKGSIVSETNPCENISSQGSKKGFKNG